MRTDLWASRVIGRQYLSVYAAKFCFILLFIFGMTASYANQVAAGTFNVRSFSPWAGYGIPNGLWLTADINGDGKTDMVHAVQGSDYVHTWISNGDGTFTVGTFRPWAGYGIPNGLWLTADINGDGKTDMVHAVQGSDYVHTWISNGDGTFTVGTFRPWAGYGIPNGIWLTGDYNGDGKTDMVHAVQGRDYAHIWLSRGDGSFTILSHSPWAGYAIPNGIWLSADITGDGRTDIIHAVTARDYVHPWISTLPRMNELSLDGLEITQAVQEMGHSVPLVADKATVARAYLSFIGTTPLTVTGVLQARRAGGSWVNVNALNATTVDPVSNYQLRSKREDLNKSLNFQIPASLLAPGTIEFRLATVTESTTGTGRVCADCLTSPVTINMSASAPMRMRVLGLRYTTGIPPNTVTQAPRTLDTTLINSWLRRAYPISSLVSSYTAIAATNTWPFDCNQANAQVATVRANDIAAGTDRRTHYFGLVSDGGGFMRGCASAIPGGPDPTAVASGPTGSQTWGWDNDGSYGDWYTGHELGHTYGRLHPGSGCGDSSDDANEPFENGQISGADGAFVGFDMGDSTNSISMSALPGVTWKDVMTYCSNQWISHYTYMNIRDRLTGESSLPAGASLLSRDHALGIPGALPSNTRVGVDTIAMIGMNPGLAVPRQKSVSALKTGTTGRSEIVTGVREKPEGAPAPSGEAPTIQEGNTPAKDQTAPSAYDAPPIVQRGFSVPPLHSGSVRVHKSPVEPDIKVQTGNLLSIIATVNISKKTASIYSSARVTKGILEQVTGPEEAIIRFVDGTGKTIKRYVVNLRRDTDIPAGKDQTGLIDAVVPFSPTATKVEVLLYGEVVDSRSISKHPPKLRHLKNPQVPGSRALGGPGIALFTWEASDDDHDHLTYTVLASTDRGKTWQTIALGLTESKMELHPEDFGKAESVLLRVIASDGMHTSVVTTNRPFKLR